MRDILLAVAAVMIVVACGESRHISDRFSQAEAVMQEYPDSALALLQAINPDDLTTDRGRAMHALLLSQAYDKNYIDLTDDSLITIAVDYFAPTNDHHYAMLAHYYHAVVNFNANDLATSSISCLEAEKHAITINNHQYLGMIYSLLAYINNYSYNFEEQLKYAQKSLEHFQMHGEEKYIPNALLNLARSFNNNQNFRESSQLYSEIVLHNADSAVTNEALKEHAHVKVLSHDYTTAKSLLLHSLKLRPDEFRSINYAELGIAYANENKLDSALFYVNTAKRCMAMTQDSAAVYRCEILISLKHNDYKKAFELKNRHNSIQGNATYTVWQQAVVKSQRDYLDQKNKVIIAERKLQQTYAFIVLGALIILIISLIIYLRNKRIKVNAKIIKLQKILEWQKSNSEDQLKINNQTIRNLKEQLMQTTDKNSDLQIELKQKTIELAEANKLIQQQLQLKELADTNIRSSELYKMMRNFILHGKAVTSLEHWEKIFNLIDGFYPHFRDTLYSLCKISDIEIKVCVLIKIGFTPTEIAILISSSKSNISSIRSRLYIKIFKKNGVSKDFDDFILSL